MRGLEPLKILPILSILSILVQAVFAQPSERLALPPELRAGELPPFGLDAKAEGGYDGVLNNDKLKALAKELNAARVVFSFFATWCLPCREGLERLGGSAGELRRRGVLVVLVNVAEKDLEGYSYGRIDEWAGRYARDGWLLAFDPFSNSLSDFGLSGGGDAPLPKTLVADASLRPLMLIGAEGSDYPQILWSGL